MGIMDMFGKAIGETMSAFGKEARTETADVRIDGPITKLVVDAKGGSVEVGVHADPTATHVDVGRTLHMYGDARPDISEDVSDGTLTLRASSVDSMRTDRVDHVIMVQAGTTVQVRTTAGNISIDGVAGPVDMNSEAGNLRATNIDSTVHVKTNAGNITLTDISGLATATTQAGAITATAIGGELTATSSAGTISARELRGGRVIARSQAGRVHVATATRPTYVEADASVGAVLVEVPAGSYAVHAKVSIGSARIENVVDDPSSESKIVASSQAGSVKVIGI